MKKKVFISLPIVWLLGCAHSPPKPKPSDPATMMRPLLIQLAGKTAVFCLKGDAAAKFRIETAVVDQMNKQGFHAAEVRSHILQTVPYSAQDVATLLLKQGFKCIAEVTYSGGMSKSGLPRHLQYNLRTLTSLKVTKNATLKTTFETALDYLVASLIQFGTQQV